MPVIPMEFVLYPFCEVRLHVAPGPLHEMLTHCAAIQQEVVVALIRNDNEGVIEPYMVGTSCEIKISLKSKEGMDVAFVGKRRFRIRSLPDADLYADCELEPVRDDPIQNQELATSLMDDIGEEYEKAMERILASQGVDYELDLPRNPVEFSFVLAHLLPMENLSMQFMLEMTDTIERLLMLESVVKEMKNMNAAPAMRRLSAAEAARWVHPN